jgi:hypothetical protein
VSRQTAIAGDRYAGYLCDRCDRPIGPDGHVTLTSTAPMLVWSCRCRVCRPNPTFDAKVDRPERFTDAPI